MRFGLALPQSDDSVPWSAVAGRAVRAEELGFHSVWTGDRHPGIDPLVGLGALARRTSGVGLGVTLDVGRRPATVLAKALATLDVLCGGRLVVGLAAGEEEPDEGVARLAEAVEVLRGMWGGGPYSFEGRYERAVGARCLPPPVQRPGPPVWLSGAADGLLGLVARSADGWIASWRSTPAAYRERVAVLHAACEELGRDPASVTLAVGLDALVGTVQQVQEQLAGWAAVGVSTVVVDAGAAPPATSSKDDLETVAEACSLEPCRTSDPWN